MLAEVDKASESVLSLSNRSSCRNDRTFWNDDNPVSDVIICAIDIVRFAFGPYYDPVPNTGIFVDNSAFDNATSSDAQRGSVELGLRMLALVKIRSHQD